MRDLRFSQGFTLNRERLASLLECITENQATSTDAIASYMGVNKPVAEGFRGWLLKTGLGEGQAGKYVLTALGKLVAEHDPYFRDYGTLWLLHYHLVSQHAERAEVWYRCFNEFLSPGKSFNPADLKTYVELQVEATPSNKDGAGKDTNTLISSYTDSDNLGELGLLVKGSKGVVSTGDIIPPHPLIAAFILLDSWPRRFGVTDSVRLSALVDEAESIGRVCVASYAQVRAYIGQIERLGLVTFADTQFEPVTRRFFDEPITLVQRYYEQR